MERAGDQGGRISQPAYVIVRNQPSTDRDSTGQVIMDWIRAAVVLPVSDIEVSVGR
jgi:hypothetical protein